MNVYDYFKKQLGQCPHEVSLRELPVDSPCGRDCVNVIDKGKALIDASDPLAKPYYMVGLNCAVEVFWLG